MSLLSTLALLGVFICTSASPTFPSSSSSSSSSGVLIERVSSLPAGWALHSTPPSPSTPISLSVALRQPRMPDLLRRLHRISDPAHATYGQHLSRDEVAAFHAPARHAADEVVRWLSREGGGDAADVVTVDGAWVRLNTTVRRAERLLATELRNYVFDGAEGGVVARATEYYLPAEVAAHVDFVHPVAHFMPPRATRARLTQAEEDEEMAAAVQARDDNAAACASGVNPKCLQQLYNIKYAPADNASSPVRFGVAGFLEQNINYPDVAQFLAQYMPSLAAPSTSPAYNFSVALVNNGTNSFAPRDAGLEACLDVQYAMALGFPTAVTYYMTGGRGDKLDNNGKAVPHQRSDNEPYLEWLDYLLALPDDQLPHVMSVSYADDEQSVPLAYARRVCDQLASLTARGTTVLAATGDGGARGQGQTECRANDGSGRKAFIPTFPASCPYVTAVGATTNSFPAQAAAFSTGGFSNYFAAPAWQKDAVAAYTSQLNASYAPLYNASGRAFPDVAAVGTGFTIVWSGASSGVVGTSASTPVVAAMVALADDARLRGGKPPLGWLNPLLYTKAVADVLGDVDMGMSDGCRFVDAAPGDDDDEEPGVLEGWPAKKGWDAVTGLGTVADFEKWLAVVAAA